MKIIAIGLNYAAHVAEFGGRQRPAEPVVFLKPDSALLNDNKPFFLPPFSERIDYETEVLVRIGKMGRNIAPKFASRYYDGIGLGIDFTARDLQQRSREAGNPWAISKGFDGSAVVSHFVPVEELDDVQQLNFHLELNGKTVQQGNTRDMLFGIDELVAYVSRYFTLRTGDILFTGTPQGVGPVHINDHLTGFLADREMFSFNVK